MGIGRYLPDAEAAADPAASRARFGPDATQWASLPNPVLFSKF